MNSRNSDSILTAPDVLVIGAGAAGVAAAAGAAEQGATVTVLEKNAFAGGKATASYVGTVCGLYYRSDTPQSEFVHHGFPKNFALALAEKSKSTPLHYKNGLHFLPYEHSGFLQLCDEWLHKSAHSVCFQTDLHLAVAENKTITALNATFGNRSIAFHPKTVVDASGENLLADLLHIDSIKSDQYQAAAQVFQVAGISETDVSVLNMGLIRAIRKGVESKLLESYFDRVSLVPGSLRNYSVLLKIPLPMLISNQHPPIAELELFSRNAVHELYGFLKTNCEPFKNSHIEFVAPEPGVRTGPRHLGKYMLTGSDVLSVRKFTDTIARGAWPVEYWEPGKNVVMEYFETDNYYDIPARCLQSDTISNLFFAGRNISADDKAIASARVIGTCLATGYAAGVLAASKSLNESEAGAIAAIQKSLAISSVGI